MRLIRPWLLAGLVVCCAGLPSHLLLADPKADHPAGRSTAESDALSRAERPYNPGRANGWGELPTEIVGVMRAKSGAYAQRALGFSCLETIRQSMYSNGVAGKERVLQYDYLLVEDAGVPGGFAGFRTKPGARDKKAKAAKVDLPYPEPFLFNQLFTDALRSTLHFKVGQWHTTPWRLAIPVAWISASPVHNKDRVSEWSGSVEVEFETGNLIRVVAHPNFQEDRLDKELQRYLSAFRFMGFSTQPPPIGLELTIDFDFEHEGFLYPTRVEVHTFRQIHRGVRATVSKLVASYSNYRFFGTHARDEIPPFLYQPPTSTPAEKPDKSLFDDVFGDL